MSERLVTIDLVLVIMVYKFSNSSENMTWTDITDRTPVSRILAISGSLRQTSSNTKLLQAAIALSPQHVEMKLYDGLNDLPHFNPDLELTAPSAVTALQAEIKYCNGLLISTPEYAHGIPGVLKNALDWLVSSEDFMGKPIAIFNASPRATHAQASLIEILTTMAGIVVSEACITVPLLGKSLDVAGIIADPKIANELENAITQLVNYIKSN
jgi:chromate reductase, NAD(P)H dehydrogenase (quinone)